MHPTPGRYAAPARKIIKAIAVLALAVFILAMGLGLYERHGPAANRSQPLETWLATFKALEVPGQCGETPLREEYAGRPAQCQAAVAARFDRCVAGPDRIDLPRRVRSYHHAVGLANRIGTCMRALEQAERLRTSPARA